MEHNQNFYIGIFLVFFSGIRFFATIIGLLSWDYVVLQLWGGGLWWMNQSLFLAAGWGEAYFELWLGKKFLTEQYKIKETKRR